MQMSSATLARCGKIALNLLTALPAALKGMLWSQADQLCPLELGDRHALGERLGHRLALHLREPRLVVERLQVRRPAGHVQVDDPLDPAQENAADGRPPSSARDAARSAGLFARPRAASAGSSSDASASEPIPPAEPPRNARRCMPGQSHSRVRRSSRLSSVKWSRAGSRERGRPRSTPPARPGRCRRVRLEPRRKQSTRRRRVRAVLVVMVLHQADQERNLRARAAVVKGPVESPARCGPSDLRPPRGSFARQTPRADST